MYHNQDMNMVSQYYWIYLCWIPSHIGVDCNEKADKLAKEAVTLPCLTNKFEVTHRGLPNKYKESIKK